MQCLKLKNYQSDMKSYFSGEHILQKECTSAELYNNRHSLNQDYDKFFIQFFFIHDAT